MEDTENHLHDSGSYFKELGNNGKEEKSSSATAFAEDAKESENGEEDPSKPRNEYEVSNTASTRRESQINPMNEANEPLDADESFERQINNERKNGLGSNVQELENKQDGREDTNVLTNESKDNQIFTSLMDGQTSPSSEASEPMNAEAFVDELTSTISKDEEIINSKTDILAEAVRQNLANGGLKEEKPTEKGMDFGNYINNMKEENLSQCKAKNPNEIGIVDANPGGHAAVEQKAAELVEAQDYYGENRQLPNTSSAIVEDQRTTENVTAGSKCGEHRELTNKPLAIAVEQKATEIVDAGNNSSENKQLPTKSSSDEVPLSQKCNEHEEMEDVSNVNEDNETKVELIEQSREAAISNGDTKKVDPVPKHGGHDALFPIQQEPVTPNPVVKLLSVEAEDHSGETVEIISTQAMLPPTEEDDDGTPEEQATFMKELESFHRERAMEFSPLKFYGEPLNFLKLWRSVMRLGGYDRVTGCKLWKKVGESFHPPKTCTTIYWTFQSYYMKHILEYERHKTQRGELQQPGVLPPEPEASGVDSENMCGSGSIKQKRPNDAGHSIKAARTETSKQLLTPVVDVGPSADWVKINVRERRDCFDVYGLVPGLLREEVRVQSDPAGRLVIMGQPRQLDNPWGVAPFKKISRTDYNAQLRVKKLRTRSAKSRSSSERRKTDQLEADLEYDLEYNLEADLEESREAELNR